MDELDTPRLRLRPLRADDLDNLVDLYADPQVARYIGGKGLDRDGTAAQLQRFLRHWQDHGCGPCAALDRRTGAFLGRIGLLWWSSLGELEVGYALRRCAWGRGLATEGASACAAWAFNEVDLDHVIALVHPANLASQRVAGRLGMRVARHDDVAGAAVLVYSITRDAWARRQERPARAGAPRN